MKNFFRNIHLYLSLASGLVISVVCLTGALLVFEKEYQMGLYPERFFVEKSESRQALDQLTAAFKGRYPEAEIQSVKVYGDLERTVELNHKLGHMDRQVAYLDPYSGKIAAVSSGRSPFFADVFALHRWLLADDTGKLIVGVSTIFFLFILITGIVLWWPKTKNVLIHRLKIKWNSGWKRLNHDLHIVVGFYSAILLFAFAFTGLAWSFQWFNDAIYWVTGTENIRPEAPKSTPIAGVPFASLEQVYLAAQAAVPGAEYYTIPAAKDPEASIAVSIMPADAAHERATHTYYFDAFSAANIGQYRYQDRNLGQKVRVTFYPIHVGSIGGLPTRILAFLACIAGFTFPFTGLIMWIIRLRKKQKQSRSAVTSVS